MALRVDTFLFLLGQAQAGGDSTMTIVGVVIGLIAGAGLMWFASRNQAQRLASAEADAKKAAEDLAAANVAKAGAEARLMELDGLRSEISAKDSELRALRDEKTTLASRVSALEQDVEGRREALETATKQLKETFEATAGKVLQGQRESFFDLAKEKLEGITKLNQAELEKRQEAIDSLLKPVDEKLKDLNVQIAELEKNREGAYRGLSEQVKALMDTQQALQKDAHSLTQALKGSSQRGRWGEIQLRRLVELAEMSPYCDFDEQSSTDGDEGRLRPDLMVKLPNQNRIIVDAKAPFNIWVEAEEAETPEARELKMKQFAAQVKTAVNQLGQKSYWSQFGSVEFVVMFLPGEHYLADALRADPYLLDYSFQKKVVLATPTTLLGLLRTVHLGWQHSKMTDAAKQIAEEGKKLHKHISVWSGHFQSVKKYFKQASDALDKTESTANRGILSTATRLEKLGARSEKALPSNAIIDLDDIEESMEVEALPEPAVGLFEEPVD